MSPYIIDAAAGIVYGKKGFPIRRMINNYISVYNTGSRNLKPFRILAHRMIWESVHGPIPAGLQINHINGIKTDNRIANLELVTPSENTYHAYRAGLSSARGEKNGRAVLTECDVREIRSSTASRTLLARKYRVSRYTIHDVLSGKSWRHVS